MAGVNRPVRQFFSDTINGQQNAQQASSTQQIQVLTSGYVVTVDPTGATGDPTGGALKLYQYATFVMGNLAPVAGISAYGAAKYTGGSWVQL
jgi:hypothetical protein